MTDFIASQTRETLLALVQDLGAATAELQRILRETGEGDNPATFVEAVLALDEQLSRTRLLMPLGTVGVAVREDGRVLSLCDLILEVREEFDALARAQIEVLAPDADTDPKGTTP